MYWDETYDRKLKGSEQVFRMEQDWSESGRFSVYFKRPLIERVRQMDPNIESVATMASWGNWTLAPEGNPGAGVSLSRAMVDETFFDVFPLTWLDGSVKEFATPSTVVLNRTMARTFFGDEPAVGKYLQNGDGTRFRVVGVYEDMPANSSIAHQSFINLGEQYLEDEGEWSFSAYLKLRDPKEAKATQARVTESLLEYFGGNAEDATDEDRDEFRREFRISNLHKAYFLQDMYPSVSTVNKSMTITLLAIALLLIVIAIINFINFSFAEIPFGIKSINTRKVLGASRRSLIRSLLLRAAVLALVAFGLSCLFLRIVAGTSWASGVAESMTVRDYVAIILPMLGVTLCAAVVAGLAPALYSTSQPAALVLKGSYAMSFKGKTLRNALVGLQFVLSFVFILLGLYVDAQLRFMKNKDMGFRLENVLQVGCSQRAGGQLLRKLQGLLSKSFGSNNLLDQAEGQSFVSLDGLAGGGILQGALLTDFLAEQVGGTGVGNEAEVDERQDEHGLLVGNDEVSRQSEGEASAGRSAIRTEALFAARRSGRTWRCTRPRSSAPPSRKGAWDRRSGCVVTG